VTTELALQVVGLVATGGIGLLAWSLNRNVRAQDDKLSAIGTDVRQLAGAVGNHGERLAAGDEQLKAHGERLQGIEDRERERGCFGRCRVEAGGAG
jgi:hypothetical protein